MGGRTAFDRENSEAPSGFPVHWPVFACCRLRGAELDQPASSPFAGIEFPFACAFEVTVEVDEFEVVEDTDDVEFDRCIVFLTPNMFIPLVSSGFIEFND